MKQFKIIDFWISVVLICAAIIYGLAADRNFFAGYFAVGFWQLISLFTHFTNNWFYARGSKRHIYEWTILILVCCVVMGFFLPPLLFAILALLVFATPFMAIYYTWICYEETFIKMKRPLSVLK